MVVEADFYDGKTSLKKIVNLEFKDDGKIAFLDQIYSLDDVVISSRLANTPRKIELNNEAVLYVKDNDSIDRYLKEQKKRHSLLHVMESKRKYVVLSLVLILAIVALFLGEGSSLVARYASKMIPYSVEKKLSSNILLQLDNHLLKPSELSYEKQNEIRELFLKLTEYDSKYTLYFRRGIGENAFALPSGDIIITDEIIKLSNNDNKMIYAILAHEMGHVEHHHSMQLLIKSSIVGSLLAYISGDVSSFLATLWANLINANYSREFEREADRYAKMKLKEANISPKHLVKFFMLIEKKSKNKNQTGYFSSHPSNKERIEFLLSDE